MYLSLFTVKEEVEHSILEEFSGDFYLGAMKLLKLFAKRSETFIRFSKASVTR